MNNSKNNNNDLAAAIAAVLTMGAFAAAAIPSDKKAKESEKESTHSEDEVAKACSGKCGKNCGHAQNEQIKEMIANTSIAILYANHYLAEATEWLDKIAKASGIEAGEYGLSS